MEATQESTQPCTDPRRVGRSNSGLLGEDVSDILCILHPNSIAAHEAVSATAVLAPQHILQKDDLEYEGSDSAALDIALRLSSNVQNLSTGFCFGRSKARCDLLLCPDDNSKRISNTHFRIHVTPDGILMLEDLSTNGTVVDDFRLRKNQKENSRMLTNGSVIQVLRGNSPSDEVRFVVRIPSRDGLAMQYTENLLHYFERVQRHQAGAVQHRARQGQARTPLHYSVANAYGMNWAGGSTYNVTGQIGHGAFATVYKLATKQHGIVYAAKELDKMRFMKNGVLDQKVDNELKIMKDLRHPNIVQYIDHHEHERWIYIIMEYVPGGELAAYLRSHGKIPEDMVQTLARQILHALNYLHKRKITHRDIKPDNILIASLEPLKVKLSDFGLSKVQDETFLKTFCGTLLYCAPEVYPEYETYRRGEIRKRRRLGDPPPKTSPYDQSVDMWSFGAVLFHILCGIPPYTGRGDDRGAQMLRTIMTTEPDYDLLRREGISEAGIDFVARLLNRDPHSRPKEAECFRHPWIRDVVDVDEYDDYEGDVQPAQMGALSDIGEDLEDELDASQISLNEPEAEGASDESHDLAQSKRPRIDYPPAEIHYPSLPLIESFKNVRPVAESTPRRLFGEITSSALRSSNVLGASIDVFDGDDLSVHDFVSSTGESIISDGNSLNSILSLPDNPFSGSAPSLMGAENLVGQLNMNSWHPGTSTHAPPVVVTPALKTSTVEQTTEQVRRSETRTGAPFNDATPKASKFSRRIELPLPDTASERSSEEATRENTAAPCDDPEAGAGEIFDIELAVTIDARTGRQVSRPPETSTTNDISDAPRDEAPVQVPQQISLHRHHSPRPLLGKLATLPGSIFDLTICLEDRMTSWGRGPQATICHPDPMDTRIPAYALEVTFWAPAIESQIAAGRDWMTVPGVMAILSTKTRKCIWVNDTELRRGSDGDGSREGFHFGKLYSGDIITVYKNRNKFLKLQCEFYHGDSARSRPDEEKGFLVRKVLMAKEGGATNRQPLRKDTEGKMKKPALFV
ncbi:serine/threonine-protein kinase [Aspergillus clavatus NRRL 1]|uniref:Serine/threonine-protein kinase ATG1 n=1 Tax=Aspergillus clavatus (strain ATCC 1007 / CBS 513.65 / DSM 816 / NCTC 3887 / NRRL 1 / QM 1276 / 107) TaxID=344612 RepID=A1C752_ASPCL|nr:protein kinase, putative [Aspergillus clavatus NRRL 1]EAW14223.1 protein kinase, putative [Aspergillus clavatus NRRL 1]